MSIQLLSRAHILLLFWPTTQYMEEVLWYIILVVAGLLWLSTSAVCMPHQDNLSNRLSTLSGFCWVLLSASAEPLGFLTSPDSSDGNKATMILLTILTICAALAPLIFALTHWSAVTCWSGKAFWCSWNQEGSSKTETELVTSKGEDVDVQSPLSPNGGKGRGGRAGSWTNAGRPTLNVEVQHHANPGAPAGATGGASDLATGGDDL